MHIFIDFDGQEYEVVWSGDMHIPLTADRSTHMNEVWDPPHPLKDPKPRRLYNKTGNHTKDKDFWAKHGGSNQPQINYDGDQEDPPNECEV